MPATFCTPVGETITLSTAQDPAAVNITIPSDCAAVYLFWSAYFGSSNNGATISSVTLNGQNPAESQNLPQNSSIVGTATGFAAWYSPATGSQSLDIAWTAAPVEGPLCIVCYVKGGTLAVRAYGLAHGYQSNPVSTTLTGLSVDDLVIKLDQRYENITTPNYPPLSSGWTNLLTQFNNTEHGRLSYIYATGSSQVCDSENENYSTVAAIAIAPAAVDDGSAFQEDAFQNDAFQTDPDVSRSLFPRRRRHTMGVLSHF
jgi:hypothetical protein